MSHRILWVSSLTAIGLFALDRVTRVLAFSASSRVLIPGLLRSDPLWNSGIAFGVHFPGAVITTLLTLLLLAVSWIGNWALRRHETLTWWVSLMIFVGAASNILDRLRYGAVRDFLRLSFWPTTGNLGDWMVTLGAIILLVSTFRKPHAPSM